MFRPESLPESHFTRESIQRGAIETHITGLTPHLALPVSAL